MSDQFDTRNFAGTIREIGICLINRYKTTPDAKPEDFWKAQAELVTIRQRAEKAYKSALQKATKEQPAPELWAFGLAMYELIVIQKQRVPEVLAFSLSKIELMARGLSAPMVGDDKVFLRDKVLIETDNETA